MTQVRLAEKYRETNRFANYGNCLVQMHVKGFRCHRDTVVEFDSPITAFCGKNGTGKSTLLQLAAAAYSSPDPNENPFYVRDFLVVGKLDPNPFTDTAEVEFRYWTNVRSSQTRGPRYVPQRLTLKRNAPTQRWSGYSKRPSREVLFIGVGLYLPSSERRDFIFRNANRLDLVAKEAADAQAKMWTSRVLGHDYDTMDRHTVSVGQREGTLLSVTRYGNSYSEAHMGYGEGRIQYLIAALETAPDQSLVLIEEPETSLHPSAQYELANYLVDVACRRHHQIVLSTHSEYLLQALPSVSRIHLHPRNDGITPIPGLTAQEARSLMTEGHHPALTILVEDECAAVVLSEVLRRFDEPFRRTVRLVPAGDADTIGRAARAVADVRGVPLVAVRDGDQGENPGDGLLKLPGDTAPEIELAECQAVVDYLAGKYDIDLGDVRASNANHHSWFKEVARRAGLGEGALLTELARAYATTVNDAEGERLVELLKASI